MKAIEVDSGPTEEQLPEALLQQAPDDGRTIAVSRLLPDW